MDDTLDPALKHLLDWLIDSTALEEPMPSALLMAIKQSYHQVSDVIVLLMGLSESDSFEGDELSPLVLGCFRFIEICLFELSADLERGSSHAVEQLNQVCQTFERLLTQVPYAPFWTPLFNLFADVGLPLPDVLKSRYYQNLEDEHYQTDEADEARDTVYQLLGDDTEHNAFDIAEVFLAQTNVMPERYYLNFVTELLEYGLQKGNAVAVLFMMHPDRKVREVLLPACSDLFDQVELSAECLTWLVMMRQWLPNDEQGFIDGLLVKQRRYNPIFASHEPVEVIEITATEMDCTGSQALFVLLKGRGRRYRVAGLLAKRQQGVTDIWISPPLTAKREAKAFIVESLEGEFDFRKVDQDYLTVLINDCLYQGQSVGNVPHINLLWLQEAMGIQWTPGEMNAAQQLQRLVAELELPIDNKATKAAFRRCENWPQQHLFTEAWYTESPILDKYVNQHCSFIDGVKHCDVEQIVADCLAMYFENQRERWLQHFIWLVMWAKPQARPNANLWRDALAIAHAIYQGVPLVSIPIMVWIAEQSIRQSLETMESRKTHLS